MFSSRRLLAVSDLHVAYLENQQLVERMEPTTKDDWLIVAGDVAEDFSQVERSLALLAARFAKVIWVPGNHELWTTPNDEVQLRGEARYQKLVDVCRALVVVPWHHTRRSRRQPGRWSSYRRSSYRTTPFALWAFSRRSRLSVAASAPRKCRWDTRGSGKLSGHAAAGCVRCYPVYPIETPKRLRI